MLVELHSSGESGKIHSPFLVYGGSPHPLMISYLSDLCSQCYIFSDSDLAASFS